MPEICVWFLLVCLNSVEAVTLRGVSARALWQQAWSKVLGQNGIDGDQIDSMPPELKEHFAKEAKELWNSWLQTQQQQHQEPEATTTTTSTYAAVVYRLTEGLDKVSMDDVVETTVTTTTEDPAKVKAREQAEEEQRQAEAKLTSGLKDIKEDDDNDNVPDQAPVQTTTTSTNPALKRLLAGIDENPEDGISFVETTTTTSTTSTTTTTTVVTTTTVDPQVIARKRQEKLQLIEMRKLQVSKLTDGFAKIDQEEATATTTTTEATTTTTTTNPDLKVLLQGLDGVPVIASAPSQSTTSTTTTTSTTFIPDQAALKTVAFITSGTFQVPHKVDVGDAEADDDSDSDSPKKQDDDDDLPEAAEAAADFDMDNADF